MPGIYQGGRLTNVGCYSKGVGHAVRWGVCAAAGDYSCRMPERRCSRPHEGSCNKTHSHSTTQANHKTWTFQHGSLCLLPCIAQHATAKETLLLAWIFGSKHLCDSRHGSRHGTIRPGSFSSMRSSHGSTVLAVFSDKCNIPEISNRIPRRPVSDGMDRARATVLITSKIHRVLKFDHDA